MPVTLEDLKRGSIVKGIAPNQTVTIVDLQWHGANAATVTFRRADGKTDSHLLYQNRLSALEIVSGETSWRINADASLLRLVSEAYRIHLAHLFDPVLAVHTSLVEPLPHQITAVYGEMISRQPLRFLLADDPGSGKTIMAGLLIKELAVRGDVKRCLICAPGSLVEQWQDELWQKFGLEFDILTRETIEASRSGNPYTEHDMAIIRLDQVSRSDELMTKLESTEWDLIVCDEAHKMSASFFGNEVSKTRRYKLGELLSRISRHFLLMTATPHNGREEDFQLFMGLLDPDRFEGRFRDGTPRVDVSDLMRRMVKENLLKFDGKPLFPERRAETIDYRLSDMETSLYRSVSEYVRDEFNRADRLDDRRKGTVGFALTVLQRRLASSPEAIYQSLVRRRARLDERLRQAIAMVKSLNEEETQYDVDVLDDLDELSDTEQEATETEILDSATAAQTAAELEAEIATLKRLEALALEVLRGKQDRKWEELAGLMQETQLMFDTSGRRHKLVLFTEHRDTLNYLQRRITTLLGRMDSVLVIHGGVSRDDRRAAQEEFANNPDAVVLLATDAAGEGINLQCAHLMVNYDLPWNPNRLEQRFGRIHRIGQREVCHLWNLVAGETREGNVYRRLLQKLEAERDALGGQVFDVLGRLFEDAPLRKLLVEAIRYGDAPETRARLEQAIDNAVDRDRLRELIEQRSLVQNTMDLSDVLRVRETMERASARRLQPHYIRSFFLAAFAQLGGSLYEREAGRYQINNVPQVIRERNKRIARAYERLCFDKRLINIPGKPSAAFVFPGHPLLDAVIGLLLDRHRDILNAGAILVDPIDPGTTPRALYYLEQKLQDANGTVISSEVHFVEIDAEGEIHAGGGAPYLDYRPPTDDERVALAELLKTATLPDEAQLTGQIIHYAVEQLIPKHLEQVQERREQLIDRTISAVHERLQTEILHWDRRAAELRVQEQAGRTNARMNSALASRRADELSDRLKQREVALAAERDINAAPPIIIGKALIVPIGALLSDAADPLNDSRITEMIAMHAVTEAEIRLGHTPRDVSADKIGYDIESRDGNTGLLRFIEVKGRQAGGETITVTRNEILRSLNAPEAFILALVEIENGQARPPRYVRTRFASHGPDFGVSGVNYTVQHLLDMSEVPQ